LLDLCIAIDKEYETLRKELEQLENYSVAVRYPGVKISVELAEEAFELANRVRQFIRKKLGLR